jgi:hypothetical protein
VYLICFLIVTPQLPCQELGLCGRYSDHTVGWDDLGEESGRVERFAASPERPERLWNQPVLLFDR